MDPEKWKGFQARYAAELKDKSRDLRRLKDQARRGNVTLVYAARDEEHNGVLVLKRLLERKPNRT